MDIRLDSKRRPPTKLAKLHPGATIVDLTSKAAPPWVRFSPFWPHGGIPVPHSPGLLSASVEGAWQGLKVFEQADVDPGKFAITDMRGLKRSVRRFGKCLGHREGVAGERLLGYLEARRAIYLPLYAFVLRERLSAELAELRALAEAGPVVVLDYETNPDVDDPSKPLSHAGLVIAWLRGEWAG
ncbi:DUF6939 family protein [Nannocystaceae bacterium ST9]